MNEIAIVKKEIMEKEWAKKKVWLLLKSRDKSCFAEELCKEYAQYLKPPQVDEQLKTLWIELLEGAMRYKIYRENGFLIQNATERYLAFRKRYPQLSERVSQQYIATYLGVKPESLSRIKNSLKGN